MQTPGGEYSRERREQEGSQTVTLNASKIGQSRDEVSEKVQEIHIGPSRPDDTICSKCWGSHRKVSHRKAYVLAYAF